MSVNNVPLGVPTESRTPEGLNLLFVDVFHDWLCENTLTFEDFTKDVLNCFRNLYTNPDARTATGVNFGFNTPTFSESSKYAHIDVNVMPTHAEVVVAGFSQSFIDTNWEEIKNSEEIQIWMTGIANQIPYLRPLSLPEDEGGTLKDKKARINKVVTLVISALWNNWCNFGEKGGVKARNETNDFVPALHCSVAHFLFQTLQRKLRSMRGTS